VGPQGPPCLWPMLRWVRWVAWARPRRERASPGPLSVTNLLRPLLPPNETQAAGGVPREVVVPREAKGVAYRAAEFASRRRAVREAAAVRHLAPAPRKPKANLGLSADNLLLTD
jgi:hypothetical protein